MACVSRSVITIAANTCNSGSFSFKTHHFNPKFGPFYASKFKIRASSDEANDCNAEECAPDKEVGKLSVEWLAEEKTRVVGTFPPRKKGWTGYIEKDTAGQTNIYSVEPAVYLAESAISSGTAGSSSEGSENTAAIAAGVGLICVAAVSSILLQVGKSTPQIPTTVYSGPSLNYYVKKFSPPQIVEASLPTPSETPSTTSESEISTTTNQIDNSVVASQSDNSVIASQSDTSSTTESQSSIPEVEQVAVESGTDLETSASNTDNVS